VTTFDVDDVAPVLDRLPTQPLASVFADAWFVGGDPAAPVIDHGATHALFGAVHRAFAEHRPLVLSPDAIWLTIAQGVAQHVRLNAEALRPHLVRHQGTERLRVAVDAAPASADEWREVIGRFTDALSERIGAGRARLFTCDFSTSSDVERVASHVVLLDAFSPYYEYELMCVCGIPRVTLTGTVDDWRRVRARIDVIAELDLDWWTRSLIPIADGLIRTAEGAPDLAFWRRIYKPRDVYGASIATGWVARLYPYLREFGAVTSRNPLVELAFDEPRPRTDRRNPPGVTSADLVSGASKIQVILTDPSDRALGKVAVAGGLVAVTQDPDGALRPIAGWAVVPARVAIDEVIARIRREDEYAEPDLSKLRSMAQVAGPADFVALARAFDGATFAGGWRLLPRAKIEQIDVTVRGFHLAARRILDLPDRTFLAITQIFATWILVRGRSDALSPSLDRRSTIQVWPERRTLAATAAELRVVGASLAEVLAGALDREGAIELPDGGPLSDHVPVAPSPP
jgi:Domain of unknown function (DUF4419)